MATKSTVIACQRSLTKLQTTKCRFAKLKTIQIFFNNTHRDFPKAAARYRAVLEHQGPHLETYINLGHALLKQGDIDGSLEAFASALELDPDNDEVLYSLVYLFRRTGKFSNASL